MWPQLHLDKVSELGGDATSSGQTSLDDDAKGKTSVSYSQMFLISLKLIDETQRSSNGDLSLRVQ